MPSGVLVIVPLPVRVTVRTYIRRVKVAVTFLAESMVTVHVLVPVHAPDQPAKVL